MSIGQLASNRPRMLAALALAIIVALLGVILLDPGGLFGDGLVRSSYDSLHVLGGEKSVADSPVVIVYLDRYDFDLANLDPAHAWPRGLHAKLIRRLNAAGTRAVIFDIVFGAAGPDTSADDELTQAIRECGRVVLAAEFTDKATHVTDEAHYGAQLRKLEPPFEPFARAAAAWGIAAHGVDDDFVVRRYIAGFPLDQEPTLTWAAAKLVGLPPTQRSNAMPAANEKWVRYYGPPRAIPHAGYSQSLSPNGVPDEFFRNKIVLIGARPMVQRLHEREDEFRSPFHSWHYRELFMPGVEVHATEMLNLVRGDWLRRLSKDQEQVLLLFCACLFGGGLVWLRPIPATALAAGGSIAALLLSVLGFSRGIWFPWMIVSAAQIPTALGGSVLFYSVEWYRARRRFEAAKREADEKIREQAALIDKAHDAIMVQDLAGKILYANTSAESLYGWTHAELQSDGTAAELFSHDAAAVSAARAGALAQGEWNGELRIQTHAGRTVVVDSRWTLIRDDDGQPKALLLINSDITEKKQLEAQFLRTQRMNTIGSLAGGIAHDLNNALAPILMGLQLLRRKTPDEESARLLGLMETSTYRSADMVRQVLLFARGRSGEFERLELNPIIKELERMVRETFPTNITVEAYLPNDLWAVRGNPTQVHQILLNLCVNARDAMPDGGRLSFAADNVELTAAEAAPISEAQAGQFVSLLVSDTGTGMPAEVRARIFEPFFTTKGEGRGTGIGLSTVLRIVKSHGGFLRVESEPGQGSTFEVFLPRAGDAAIESAPQEPTELPRGNDEAILVVDDEQAIRSLIGEGLAAQGYRVFTAANGEEALQLFRQRAAEIRLVITDSAMPVMDGPRSIAEIRKLRADLPIILASGEAQVENGPAAKDILLLSKPFSLEEIVRAVHRMLGPEAGL